MATPKSGEVPKAQGLAAALRAVRSIAGLTQGQAAAAIGVSRQAMNAYEREDGGWEPGPEAIGQLAAVYRTTPERIMFLAKWIAAGDAATVDRAAFDAGVAFATGAMEKTLESLRAASAAPGRDVLDGFTKEPKGGSSPASPRKKQAG